MLLNIKKLKIILLKTLQTYYLFKGMNNSISSSIAIFKYDHQQPSNAEMEALETCAKFMKQY